MSGFLLGMGHAAGERLPLVRPPSVLGAPDRYAASPQLEIQKWGDGVDLSLSVRTHSVLIGLGRPDWRDAVGGAPDEWQRLHDRLDTDHSAAVCESVARRVSGGFAFLFVHCETGTTSVVTDRVGSRAIWWWQRGDRLLVSSHAVAIRQVVGSGSWNPGGLGAFLLYGGPIDPSRTVFEDIEAVPEASVHVHVPGGAPIRTRWYQFRHDPVGTRSRSQWASLVADRVRDATRQGLERAGRPALFLSGGTDSRVAAAALHRAGYRDALLVTLADADNAEVRVARRVAGALGMQHQTVYRDRLWYLRAAESTAFTSDARYRFTHSHFSQAVRQVRAESSVGVFLLGDFFEAFAKLFAQVDRPGELWSPEDFVDRFDAVRLPDYRPRHRSQTLRLLQPEVREAVDDGVRRDVQRIYEESMSVSTDPRIVVDYLCRWRNAHCLPTYQMFLDVRGAGPDGNVMLDAELHALLEQMPADVRSSGWLGKHVVQRLHAGAAWQPSANTFLPLVLPTAMHDVATRIRPLVGTVRRALQRGYRTPASWPHLPQLYRRDATWRARLERTMCDGDGLPADLFAQSVVAEMWRAFLDGDQTVVPDIEALLSFSEINRII